MRSNCLLLAVTVAILFRCGNIKDTLPATFSLSNIEQGKVKQVRDSIYADSATIVVKLTISEVKDEFYLLVNDKILYPVNIEYYSKVTQDSSELIVAAITDYYANDFKKIEVGNNYEFYTKFSSLSKKYNFDSVNLVYQYFIDTLMMDTKSFNMGLKHDNYINN